MPGGNCTPAREATRPEKLLLADLNIGDMCMYVYPATSWARTEFLEPG